MCLMCEGMTAAQYRGKLRDIILRRGWAVVAVEDGGDSEPAFGYTVGLSRWDHPELIMFGAHAPCCATALDRIAELVCDGRRFDEGADLSAVFPEGRGELLRFPDSSTHLFVANEFYRPAGGAPVPALQLYFPARTPLLWSG